MTKQYIRYICNRIIFTVIIWLCVCVPLVSSTISEVTIGCGCSAPPTSTTVNYGTDWICYAKAATSHYGGYTGLTRIYLTDNGSNIAYYQSSDGCGASSYPCGCDGACPNYRQGCKLGSARVNGSVTLYASTGGGSSMGSCAHPYGRVRAYYGEDFYTISGCACGNGMIRLTDMSHPMHEQNLLSEWDTSINPDYSFDVMNNTHYKVEFVDRTYQFFVSGNIVENNDLCDWHILHYVDDCANLFKNPCINIIKNDNYAAPLISDGTSHTDVFKIGEDIELNDKLDIWIGTDQGEQFRTVYGAKSEDYISHSYKSWDLGITIYDINTSACVADAKVTVDQDCRINGYQSCTYGTTNFYGFVKTFDLSNQPYRVKVEKENYNTFGYTTINAGFDAQHTNVPLTIYIQDSTKGDGNGTIGDPPNGGEGGGGDTVLPQTECSILWTDNAGNSITEINDTQDARLYFMASNCSTVLTLESRDINAHTWDVEDSVSLTPLQTGYVQYGAANWTYPETKRYQGRLFAYDCGCDVIDDLKVWDASDPNTTLINNLSANVWFRHTIGSSYVNPSSPIKITSYAASNNTSLLNINLSLFNESVKVDEISYTFFDYYVNNQFKGISWNPNYQYTAGYRYSIYMYSNDILVDFDTVFANATGNNPFDTGNTLTVKVYDHNSLPLQYSTVYVESWGLIDTGATNEVIFTGLGDDTYEYRAIKGGYLDRGFDSVTLSADTTVSYILDIIDTEHAIRDIRMADGDIKAMLYPIVFFILIMLLIGVLIDAVN